MTQYNYVLSTLTGRYRGTHRCRQEFHNVGIVPHCGGRQRIHRDRRSGYRQTGITRPQEEPRHNTSGGEEVYIA